MCLAYGKVGVATTAIGAPPPTTTSRCVAARITYSRMLYVPLRGTMIRLDVPVLGLRGYATLALGYTHGTAMAVLGGYAAFYIHAPMRHHRAKHKAPGGIKIDNTLGAFVNFK